MASGSGSETVIHYLYTAADDSESLNRAEASSAAGLLVDLEDGVLAARKEVARAHAREFLGAGRHGARHVLVRINEVGGAHWERDLEQLAGVATTFLLPKLSSVKELRAVEAKLEEIEREGAGVVGSHRLAILIETAVGLVNLRDLVEATPRAAALVFGQADFTVDVGTSAITADGFRPAAALDFAHAQIVFTAAAYGLRSIVAPWAQRNDTEAQEREMRRLFGFGYDAMVVSAPHMVEVVERAFAPLPKEAEFAEGVLRAADEARAGSRGVTTYRGWLIEGAYVDIAKRLLARQGQ